LGCRALGLICRSCVEPRQPAAYFAFDRQNLLQVTGSVEDTLDDPIPEGDSVAARAVYDPTNGFSNYDWSGHHSPEAFGGDDAVIVVADYGRVDIRNR
jgi:hypothetical protein